MTETFATMLMVGGKANTLGRAEEIIDIVLNDQSRLEELYHCLFDEDAWVRMRAMDALEKICRVYPEWLRPYREGLLSDIAAIEQASIKWHLAELYREMELTSDQRDRAIGIMKRNIATVNADWIVASTTMQTLGTFVQDGYLPAAELLPLLKVQQAHHSKAVVKRATKILAMVTGGTA